MCSQSCKHRGEFIGWMETSDISAIRVFKCDLHMVPVTHQTCLQCPRENLTKDNPNGVEEKANENGSTGGE